MKQFFKFTMASMLGFILANLIIFIISFAIIIGIASSFDSEKEVKVKENSILKLDLSRPIVDRSSDNPFENFDFNTLENTSPIGLRDITESLEKAAADDRIKGVYVELSGLMTGFASVNEIRKALLKFKESGKFIIAYGETMTQGAYFLGTTADELYLFPEGSIDFRGLRTELMFFKGALDKLGIEMQVIRGKNNKFKSAVEPFLYDKMSDENREQVSRFLNVFWDEYLNEIAVSRNIEKSLLNEYADNWITKKPKMALNKGFVDGLKFKDQVDSILMNKVAAEKFKDVNFVSMTDYFKVPKSAVIKIDDKEKPWNKKDYLAIVYAEGEIRSGKNQQDIMGSETTRKALQEAAEDSTIKAVVLRVNSPGGSAMASEVILREVIRTQTKKPVIVSMGNLAASGGYYISCKADKIFANNATITGSIGVFGLIPNAQKLLEDKMGFSFDGVKTNELGDLGDINKPLSIKQYAIIQEMVEETYSTFLNHVAEGRGLSVEKVDSIGQGRVWTGLDAKDLGLVDEIGSLEDALNYSAELVNLEDFKVKEFPKKEDPFKAILRELNLETKTYLSQWLLGDDYAYYKQMDLMKNRKGIQALMPLQLQIDF